LFQCRRVTSESSEVADRPLYPPPQWEVNPLDILPTYRLANETSPLEGALLLEVQPDGRISGEWRFVHGGSAILSIEVVANQMVSAGGSSGFTFQWQLWPRDIKLRPNTLSSEWFDLTDR
jgi:hypothetical protein